MDFHECADCERRMLSGERPCRACNVSLRSGPPMLLHVFVLAAAVLASIVSGSIVPVFALPGGWITGVAIYIAMALTIGRLYRRRFALRPAHDTASGCRPLPNDQR